VTSAPAFIETLRELPPDRVRDLLADSEAAGSRIVRCLYVLTPSRRLGVGRQLMTRVIDGARGRFDTLRLRTNREVAARLYAATGFRPVAGDGEFTHVLELVPRSG
jgi:GNAT superfamily N-acetyltransferase